MSDTSKKTYKFSGIPHITKSHKWHFKLQLHGSDLGVAFHDSWNKHPKQWIHSLQKPWKPNLIFFIKTV